MCFYLVGPTAVGKTEIAAAVAERCGAEIISADAFGIYRGLPILTAKPTPATLARVPHHLVGEIPLAQAFDVAQFVALAHSRAQEIAARGRHVLVVGGTGLYVRALMHGLADLPKADPQLRAELDLLPLAELQRRYAELDPPGARRIDLGNRRRLIRALEVCLLTGKPFSTFRGGGWKPWPQLPGPLPLPLSPQSVESGSANAGMTSGASASTGFLLLRERGELYARIDERVRAMFRSGVVDEVRRSLAEGPIGPTAAQALGLREVQALLRGEIDKPAAVARLQQATRRYAKRQLTWFRRDRNFEQLNLTTNFPDSESVITHIAERILSAGRTPSPPRAAAG